VGGLAAELITLPRGPEGASIAEIVAATGWQEHMVRRAISGAVKKRLGLEETSQKVDARDENIRSAATITAETRCSATSGALW
jgi:hypothetical protein